MTGWDLEGVDRLEPSIWREEKRGPRWRSVSTGRFVTSDVSKVVKSMIEGENKRNSPNRPNRPRR